MEGDDCYKEIFILMEQFLDAKANGYNSGFIVDELNKLIIKCNDYVKPFIDAINGVEPVGLSSAMSYYMYVAYIMGKIKVNKEFINGLNSKEDPRDIYNEIYARLINALKVGDNIAASFLADLAFIIRSYILCRENNNAGCEWLMNAFRNRLTILLSY